MRSHLFRDKFFAMRCVILPIFLCAVSYAPADAQPRDTEFTIITYNVQFLPGMASVANKRKQPEYRAQRIAAEVSAYDIVALQETFHEAHRPALIDALQDALDGSANLVIAPKPEAFFANGGTLIATRYPILESNDFVYTRFSTPEEYGISADGYSAKGVIHARVQLSGGQLLDIFNTHLEAREPEFRPSQYGELADFIAEYGDVAVPALLVGDMNTNGVQAERDDPDSGYALFLSELQRARPGTTIVDLWPALHPEALGGTSEQESTETGKRIDYIIALQPAANAGALMPIAIEIQAYADEQVTYLSDHNAVIARMKIADSQP